MDVLGVPGEASREVEEIKRGSGANANFPKAPLPSPDLMLRRRCLNGELHYGSARFRIEGHHRAFLGGSASALYEALAQENQGMEDA